MKIWRCAISALLLAGCTPTIEFGRRSANEPQFPTTYRDPIVHVSSTAQAARPDAPPGYDGALGYARLQLQFANPGEDAIKAVRKALEAQPASVQFASDRTVAKRTIVVSVTRGEYRPADRFVNFRLRIQPVNFAFSGYTGTQTDYSTIDIETVSLSKTNSVGVEINGGAGGSTTGKASTGRDAVLSESGGVTARIENVTTNLEDKTLEIYREAERGIDLSGNTLVNIGVTARAGNVANDIDWGLVATSIDIAGKDGKIAAPEAASVRIANLSYLKPRDLKANLVFDYVMRRVLTKSNEYAEHDQTVEYEEGTCEKADATIVSASDLAIPRWSIFGMQGNVPVVAVNLDSEFGDRPLAFVDYADAVRFAAWMMKQRANRVGASRLSLPDGSGLSLDRQPYPGLSVRPSGEVPSATDVNEAPQPWHCQRKALHASPSGGGARNPPAG